MHRQINNNNKWQHSPKRSSLSSLRASRLSLRSCLSISWLIRFCSLASSDMQHSMVRHSGGSRPFTICSEPFPGLSTKAHHSYKRHPLITNISLKDNRIVRCFGTHTISTHSRPNNNEKSPIWRKTDNPLSLGVVTYGRVYSYSIGTLSTADINTRKSFIYRLGTLRHGLLILLK